MRFQSKLTLSVATLVALCSDASAIKLCSGSFSERGLYLKTNGCWTEIPYLSLAEGVPLESNVPYFPGRSSAEMAFVIRRSSDRYESAVLVKERTYRPRYVFS